ncbi:MAG: hypothetical protein V1928_00405 [Parcubacteria group bacterium]
MAPKQKNLLVNTNEDNCVKENHICYYTKEESNNEIVLVEVVERLYRHPECLEYALIPIIETRNVRKLKRTNAEAGTLVLMEANQTAVSYQEKLKGS